MRADRLESLRSCGVAFDTETHMVQPGLLAPPLVCGSIQGPAGPGRLLDKDQTRSAFEQLLRQDHLTIAGANIAYDMLVMAVDAARRGIDLMPVIFDAYEQERVFDVQIAEMLHAIAGGHLGMDPRTGGALKDPVTGKQGRYSLAIVSDLVLGFKGAKANDRFRFSYALLEDTPIEQWPIEARTYPVDDAVNTRDVALRQVERNENLHNLAAQCYAAWAMHLGAAWGFVVDPPAVDALEAKARKERGAGLKQFLQAGLLVWDQKREQEKKATAVIKRKVAEAYGASEPCAVCAGSGKVPSTSKAKNAKPIGCKACSASGYDLDRAPIPRTETGGVQTSRDCLAESGDELLMDFAAFSEADKILTTYIPFLRQGVDEQGRARPLILRPNVLVDTGRASYGDVAHQLPRSGGVRECIVARPGRVLCSSDYTGLELASHAQSCLWIVGWSKLADALNSGRKVHNALGASMSGVPYDRFNELLAVDKFLQDCRQAAKPGNFGFPGGMGAAKLVLQQRKQGPDTVGPDGRKYKGLRFCILTGGEQTCGHTKVNEWKGKPLPPTCLRCIECAESLRRSWFEAWPENQPYFEYVASVVDNEQGRVVQHVSNRVRGNTHFTNAANGYFQGLAADGAKLALCRAAREEYVEKSSPLYGSRTIIFAHDELVVEMPEDRAHEAAARLSQIMVESMRCYIPDVAIEAEPALMRRWYKGAAPVYENGRLVPWEPS